MATPPRSIGLSAADITAIRGALADGRRPKVLFTDTAGQMAGQAGNVVTLADPATAEEWIVVRFGRDELPFSPADLSMPVRGRRAGPPARLSPTRPAQRAGRGSLPAPASRPSITAPAPATRPPEAGVATPAGAVNGLAKPVRTGKPKLPVSLVVTLTYAEKEWTVAATQGARSLAKPHVIKPADALRMVALIDVPSVHEAVEAIISAERVEAEGRAQRLRTELAEIETRLAELSHSS